MKKVTRTRVLALVACGVLAMPGVAGAAPFSYTSTDVPQSITDFNTTNSVITILKDDLITSNVIVQFRITHTYDADLVISLVSPTLIPILLVDQRGGFGDNFTGTTLDQTAGIYIDSGSAPSAAPTGPKEICHSSTV